MTVTTRSQTGSLLQFWGWWGIALAIAFAAVAFAVWQRRDSEAIRALRLLDEAIECNQSGNRLKAEKLATEALRLDPTLGRAAMLAAESAVARQDFESAFAAESLPLRSRICTCTDWPMPSGNTKRCLS